MIKALVTDTKQANRSVFLPVTSEEAADSNERIPPQPPTDGNVKRTTRKALGLNSMFKKPRGTRQYVLAALIALALIAPICLLLLSGRFLIPYIKGKLLTISLL